MTEDPKKIVGGTAGTKGDSPPREELAQRREFLLRSGKILTYSVPVIVSFQASQLRAMASGSLGTASQNNGPDKIATPEKVEG
jgi:hypothetical protein